MMIALLLIMIVLAAHSFFLEGAEKGIEFYLIPNQQITNPTTVIRIVQNAMVEGLPII